MRESIPRYSIVGALTNISTHILKQRDFDKIGVQISSFFLSSKNIRNRVKFLIVIDYGVEIKSQTSVTNEFIYIFTYN